PPASIQNRMSPVLPTRPFHWGECDSTRPRSALFLAPMLLRSVPRPTGTNKKGQCIMSASVVYVANNGSQEVSVIATATNTVVATAAVDGAPIRLAVTPDGKRAFIAIRTPVNTGTVSVLDAAANTLVATETVTDFFIAGVAITPDGKQAYVANSGNA